jgi:hypothetical protein
VQLVPEGVLLQFPTSVGESLGLVAGKRSPLCFTDILHGTCKKQPCLSHVRQKGALSLDGSLQRVASAIAYVMKLNGETAKPQYKAWLDLSQNPNGAKKTSESITKKGAKTSEPNAKSEFAISSMEALYLKSFHTDDIDRISTDFKVPIKFVENKLQVDPSPNANEARSAIKRLVEGLIVKQTDIEIPKDMIELFNAKIERIKTETTKTVVGTLASRMRSLKCN